MHVGSFNNQVLNEDKDTNLQQIAFYLDFFDIYGDCEDELNISFLNYCKKLRMESLILDQKERWY